MRFTVYHAMPEFFGDAHFRLLPLDHYMLVATVECAALGQVFQVTNHIESNWTENPEVIELFTPKDKTRSTSVGDVVSDELGRFHRVEGMGWRDVTAELVTA